MRYLLLILLSFVICGGAKAQNIKFEYQDICGDPQAESMLWLVVSGRVVEIIDGDSLIFKQSNGVKKIIDLSAIDSSLNEPAAKDFLVKSLLNKKAEIRFNPSKAKDEKIWASIRSKNSEINRSMIEQGISIFRQPEAYSFSNYKACVYRQLEEKAKQGKIGIWAK